MVSTLADRVAPGYDVLQMARAYWPQVRVCHRLDKATSGLLVFAKHDVAYKALFKQFEQCMVQRTYHAVVHGMHGFRDHLIESPAGAKPRSYARLKRHGKYFATVFDTLEVFLGYTLVACRPVAGRAHQIRVHAACQRAPLVGDIRYGGKVSMLSALKQDYKFKKDSKELPLMGRVALHAYALAFTNLENRTLRLQASYPKDFEVFLKKLHCYGKARSIGSKL